MKQNENGEIILNAHESYYLADMIKDLTKYCNGNEEEDEEGMYIKEGIWITPETCYIMKKLMELQNKTCYQKEIKILEGLSSDSISAQHELKKYTEK